MSTGALLLFDKAALITHQYESRDVMHCLKQECQQQGTMHTTCKDRDHQSSVYALTCVKAIAVAGKAAS